MNQYGYPIKRYTGNDWYKVTGACTTLVVDDEGYPWQTTVQGQIWMNTKL